MRRAAVLACSVLLASGALVLAGSAGAAASTVRELSIVAGIGTSGPSIPGPATDSSLDYPGGVAVDPSTGDVYIADTSNNVVEQVTPSGTLSIVAGDGLEGSPTPGPATDSSLYHPFGVAVDPSTGDLYIADYGNNVVEQVTPSGTLSIVAGDGLAAAPVPGPAKSSPLDGPAGVALDVNTEDLYIADQNNNVVEQVTPSGTLSIVAGTGAAGAPTPGPAISSPLDRASGVGVDPSTGDLYIADYGNNVVEQVTPSGTLSIVAGDGTSGAPTPGPARSSPLNGPYGVAAGESGSFYIADLGNSMVEFVTAPLSPQTITFTSTPPTSPSVGGTYTVAATGGASGNPATFSIGAYSTAGACSISGSTVSFKAPGTCVIDANQAGSTSYAAATQAQETLTVAAAPVVVTTPAPVPVTPSQPVRSTPAPVPVAPSQPVRSTPAPAPGPKPKPTPEPKPKPKPPVLSPTSATHAWSPHSSHGQGYVPVPVEVSCEHARCVGLVELTVARRDATGYRHPVLAKGRIDLRAGRSARVELRITPTGTHIFSRDFSRDVARHGHFRVTLTTLLYGVRPRNTRAYLKP